MDLSELKRDKELLLAVLGRKKAGQHGKCPWHEDQHGSLAIWRGGDGVWLWKCHAGCGAGTILDAAMRAYGADTPAEALRAIERELGVRVGRDEGYVEPRIDLARAERFIAFAHGCLMNDFDVQERLLAGKRGITELGLVEMLRLGFVHRACFPEWHAWRVTGWVLPVTDAAGKLLAVKLHTEGRRDPKMPKCLWAPFGTYPATKPRHGTYTLWPPPEIWRQVAGGPESFYLCPGELKALAAINVGIPATAATVGEGGKLPKRLIARLKGVAARRIFLPHDQDSTGRAWGESLQALLRKEGLPAFTFAYNARKVSGIPTPAVGAQERFLDLMDSQWAKTLKAQRGAPVPGRETPL